MRLAIFTFVLSLMPMVVLGQVNDPCTSNKAVCKMVLGKKHCGFRGQTMVRCHGPNLLKENKNGPATYVIQTNEIKQAECKENAMESFAKSGGNNREFGASALAAARKRCERLYPVY